MRKTASTMVPVHPLLAERWSPRGFDQAHEIGDEALAALLEAAPRTRHPLSDLLLPVPAARPMAA
jgi:predicted amidophosphoribosyltransferase